MFQVYQIKDVLSGILMPKDASNAHLDGFLTLNCNVFLCLINARLMTQLVSAQAAIKDTIL